MQRNRTHAKRPRDLQGLRHRGSGSPARAEIDISVLPELAIVSLKVSRRAADQAAQRLQLPPPLRTGDGDPRGLWLAPDHWLLTSRVHSAAAIIRWCGDRLLGVLFNAVDQSAAYRVVRVAGAGAADLLAAGTSLDLRARQFPVGSCCRTNLAQIPLLVVAADASECNLYVESGYVTYLLDWLVDTADMGDVST